MREAIASLLPRSCARRPSGHECHALDLGANNGWFTSMLLQLGARVTAVEPQPDLARAARETAELNCWADRLTMVNAKACANTSADTRSASRRPRVPCMGPPHEPTTA